MRIFSGRGQVIIGFSVRIRIQFFHPIPCGLRNIFALRNIALGGYLDTSRNI